MRFKLGLKADGGDITNATNTTIINGSHSLIKHMVVRSAGKIIYDTDNLHLVTFVKNLLEYSHDYSRSVAKNSLWYLNTTGTHVEDDNTGFGARRLLTSGREADGAGEGQLVDTTIPLNKKGVCYLQCSWLLN